MKTQAPHAIAGQERPAIRPPWRLAAVRSAVAIIVGVPITFISEHSAFVGLVALAVLAGGTGIALLAAARSVPTAIRRWPLLAGTASLALAVLAAVLAAVAPTAELFAATTVAWMLSQALPEGWAVLATHRLPGAVDRRTRADWRAVAAFTGVAALVFAVIPRDEVTLVGLLGVYGVIVGVYLAIAAFSIARPGTERA